MNQEPSPAGRKSILITGASSGIGEALAWVCAKNGMNLALVARRLERLENIAEKIREKYQVQVEVAALDVCDSHKASQLFNGFSRLLGKIDIVVANAGILKGRKIGDGRIERDAEVFQTNVIGAIATGEAAIGMFRMQGAGGQLAVISSYSAFMPLPSGAAYSASKAAVSNYFNAVRMPLLRENISVNVIYPGFVSTDLLRGFNSHGLPIIAKASDVAEEIFHAIIKNRKNTIVPRLPWGIIRQLQRLVPDTLLMNLQKYL